MKTAASILILIAALAPSAAPAGPAPQGGTEAAPPRRIGATEKVQVDLVLVDVVVRDRRDRPVAGLSRDDFELLVDRLPVAPADIETFEEICPAAPPSSPGGVADLPAAPPGGDDPVGSAEGGPPRHIILYFDFSQLSMSGRRQALLAARGHVSDRLGPRDRVMILAFKEGLRLVQDFTSDHTVLVSRIQDLIASNATHDLEVIEESQNLADVGRLRCDPSGAACTARRAAAAAYAAREELRARRSLRAVESLLPALEAIDGRKALVLFTDVLRQDPGIQYISLARSTPEKEGISLSTDLLRLTRESNAAGVSFYTVHASGLDDSTLETFRDGRDETKRIGGGDDPGFRSDTYEAARSGLDAALALQTMLAVETGGRALQRTNDLSRIIDTARQDLSCYYLLGYRHPATGDGRRHSLLVRLRSAGGEARRGLTVRYRPYFTDLSREDRRARVLRSALAIPELHADLPITTEAFALAPDRDGRRVLIKATVPLEDLTLLPQDNAVLSGAALVRGEVTRDGDARCTFEHQVPVSIDRRDSGLRTLVFETGCVLPPGAYELSVAVMDVSSREIGARRSPLLVPDPSSESRAWISDVHLWARDPRSLLVTMGTERVGIKDGRSDASGYIPLAERRIASEQEAMLSFLLCPAPGEAPTPEQPIRVHRVLRGEGDRPVADFRDLLISEPPDADTGCYQIVNAIPADSLGDGLYRLTIQLRGASLGAPLTREADFAVN